MRIVDELIYKASHAPDIGVIVHQVFKSSTVLDSSTPQAAQEQKPSLHLANTMTLKQSTLVALAAAMGAQAQLFTVNCSPLTQFRGDPIVSPGVLSSHVHAVVGGTAFSLTTTPDQARAAVATTCDKILDNSNYWQPQLYHQRTDGLFELVTFQGSVSWA